MGKKMVWNITRNTIAYITNNADIANIIANTANIAEIIVEDIVADIVKKVQNYGQLLQNHGWWF